jgi:short-subunit dehydrogenase
MCSGDEGAGWGKIINIASIDGFKPEPFVSLYSISKAGCG